MDKRRHLSCICAAREIEIGRSTYLFNAKPYSITPLLLDKQCPDICSSIDLSTTIWRNRRDGAISENAICLIVVRLRWLSGRW